MIDGSSCSITGRLSTPRHAPALIATFRCRCAVHLERAQVGCASGGGVPPPNAMGAFLRAYLTAASHPASCRVPVAFDHLFNQPPPPGRVPARRASHASSDRAPAASARAPPKGCARRSASCAKLLPRKSALDSSRLAAHLSLPAFVALFTADVGIFSPRGYTHFWSCGPPIAYTPATEPLTAPWRADT